MVALKNDFLQKLNDTFHGCVHNMLQEKSEDILRGLYKSASFVVQAIIFKQIGNYIKHQKELLPVAIADEQVIVNTFLSLKNGGAVDYIPMSETLFGQKSGFQKIVKPIPICRAHGIYPPTK